MTFDSSQLTVRVAIPHYFTDSSPDRKFGSSRPGNRLRREYSLYSSITSLLEQAYCIHDVYMHLANQSLSLLSNPAFNFKSIHLDINVFVNNSDFLQDTIDLLSPRITVHHLNLDDPRELPFFASRWLIDHQQPLDLSYYAEDDLVLRDPLYFIKQAWFLKCTNFSYVLMPHRYELSVSRYPQRLYVDGPNAQFKSHNDEEAYLAQVSEPVMAAKFPGYPSDVSFHIATNPHSGTFTLHRSMIPALSNKTLSDIFYISPLESASTGLVRSEFPILKTAWSHSNFLRIAHDNPSFLSFLNRWEPSSSS